MSLRPVDLLHGAVLALALAFCWVTAFYGWEWASEVWASVQLRDPVLALLWSFSILGWLGFSIAGQAKVIQREDVGRTTDRWGRE